MRPKNSSPWDQVRKHRIVEIVNDLLEATIIHREIEGLHRHGKLRFSHIEPLIDDRGESLLYRLKENCHVLFRNRDDGSPPGGEKLLDLAVGSVFHEAMKLRENLYQVDTYKPRYSDIRLRNSPHQQILLERFEKIVLRAEQAIREGVADITAFFTDILDQLLDLIQGYKDNDLLVRFLITNRSLFVRVYGKKRFEQLLTTMFEKGLVEAYAAAAMSYLRSAYYEMACHLFAKAIRLNPGDGKLRFFYGYAKGFDAYYGNNYEKALRFFGELLDFNQRFRGKRDYLYEVMTACRDIATDSLAEQKKTRAARARRLAHRLKGRSR
jgi:tetratricopeptide (TPR) repeat protein